MMIFGLGLLSGFVTGVVVTAISYQKSNAKFVRDHFGKK
jgi:hypothetical protein